MEMIAPAKTSLVGLFRNLTGETRTFIQQEIRLAKTELSEKISRLGRNAVTLAIGGFIAYAGLIVFLIGVGWLLAWAFETAGLPPGLASFVGLAVIGLLVTIAGCGLLLKGIKTLSREPLTPQRTMHTLQELKGSSKPPAPRQSAENSAAPANASSAEMEARVQETETRLGQTLDELGRRLSPQYISAQTKRRIQANPYRSGLIAMGAGLISGLLLRRRFRHA